MKKIVVLSGAGISAESGIKTFRDSNGLWEGHDVQEVATPEGFRKNPQLVLDFYNQRRRQLLKVKPNTAHDYFADLQTNWDVHVITQNVDDLHERSGSNQVIHLHGELLKARSSKVNDFVQKCTTDIKIGDTAEDGSQLRPHIVWFGEQVPMLEVAIDCISNADVVVIVGTSMQVYPAASLYQYAPDDARIFYIDPNSEHISVDSSVVKIPTSATKGVEVLDEFLKSKS